MDETAHTTPETVAQIRAELRSRFATDPDAPRVPPPPAEVAEVSCPHCGAPSRTGCVTFEGLPITTLPAHDARYAAAGLASPPPDAERLARLRKADGRSTARDGDR